MAIFTFQIQEYRQVNLEVMAPLIICFLTPTNHLFKAVPKDKKARIEVLVTDRFGTVYKQLVKE